jgi:hypothetical protein
MKLTLISISFLFNFTFFYAQSPKEIVNSFFKKMTQADTTGLSLMFTKHASLQSVTKDVNGNSQLSSVNIADFIKSITKYKSGMLDERIYNLKSVEMKDIASVSMDYDFYNNKKYSHSGVNLFTFLHNGKHWLISTITDTRYFKSEEQLENKDKVEQFLDKWHLAASTADAKTYFDMLDEKSIFIGTDESEVWTKQQFYSFAAPYFEKGKAWDFVKKSRNIYTNSVNGVIWFDEVLDTWMGPCRGSGFIVTDENNNMKIMQYVLSLTVPNEKIEQVIKAIDLPVRKR